MDKPLKIMDNNMVYTARRMMYICVHESYLRILWGQL
ncbi:MAG: hypothetical protein JWQ85_582 [Mucilaginibacter sp.]|jgi:hypothetical protein|nr:hypothetical protein [Mucilaginibacter sp.]